MTKILKSGRIMKFWPDLHVWPYKEGDDSNYRNADRPNILFLSDIYVAQNDFKPCLTIPASVWAWNKAMQNNIARADQLHTDRLPLPGVE